MSNGGTAATVGSDQWTVSSSASFPGVSSSPPVSFCVADTASTSEIIQVTAITSNVWSVLRGAEGSTPVTHASNFTVQQVVTAGALQNFTQYPNSGAVAFTGVTNSTVATTIASYIPPATDVPAAGVVYDVNAYGFITTPATTATLTVALMWGATTVVSAVTGTNGSALPATALARAGTWIEGRVTCTNTTVMTGALNLQTYNAATPLSIANASTVASTVSGTALSLTVKWSSAATTWAFTAASSYIHRIS